jgi:hypothetical protein
MNSTNDEPVGERENLKIVELAESVRRSFPAVRYLGKVTSHDGEWLPALTEENAILEDDRALYEGLSGRTWTEIPPRLINDVPDGLPLLTDEAFVAFVPAWLARSLENIDGENEVRNFIVFTFSPRPDMVPDMTQFITNRIRILSPQQRLTVRSLLAEFANSERSGSIRADAARAVKLIDTVR